MSRLIEMAVARTGLTRRELAGRLDRDRGRLIVADPKLSYLARLSGMLEMEVGDVAEFVSGLPRPGDAESEVASAFAAVEAEAKEAYRSGEYERTIELARRAASAAGSSDERARARNLEAAGLDGLGRYPEVLTAAQLGLAEECVSAALRRRLCVTAATAHYALRHLYEARSMAGELIEWYGAHPPDTVTDRLNLAHAHYVRGHTFRRLLRREPECVDFDAPLAKADLEIAIEMYEALADETGIDSYRGVANTCRGGLVEVAVELKAKTPRAAVEALLEGLDAVADAPAGDWLESYGWWCVFAWNITQQHLSGEPDFPRLMATFTGLARDVAERSDNWALFERFWCMEYERRASLVEFGVPLDDWRLDNGEVREILGTVNRFPTFREAGWRILQTATIIGG